MICSCWLRAMTSYQSEIWNFVLILRRCEKTVSAEMPRRVAICLAFRPEALSVRMRCSASVSFGKGACVLDDSYSDSSDSGSDQCVDDRFGKIVGKRRLVQYRRDAGLQCLCLVEFRLIRGHSDDRRGR